MQDAEAVVRSDGPVVLFDGRCGFCHAAVRFVLRRDPKARFHFAALRSAAAREVLAGAGWNGLLPDSLVVVVHGRVLFRSDAVLAIAARLRWPWPLCGAFRLVPRSIRDRLYDTCARRRHVSGPMGGCPVQAPAERARFLDADEPPQG